MCSINHELKAIYIHIPKTGGLYIEHILEKYYGFTVLAKKNELHSYFINKDKNIVYNNNYDKEGMLTLSKKGIYRYCSISNYFNFILEMDDTKWNNYYKFTFVRNPYDKIFSAWKYCKKINYYKKDFKDFVFESFDSCIDQEDFHNKNYLYFHGFITQYEHLLNKYKLLDINYIGRFENLNNDLILILKKIGITNILHDEYIKKNIKINESFINEDNKIIRYYQYYDNNILKKVNNLFFDDFKKFNYKIFETIDTLIGDNKDIIEYKTNQ